MVASRKTCLPLLLISLSAACTLAQAKTCLMLYQVADNNLEFYLRQDYQELALSPLVQSADVKTWVYYDAFNMGGQAIPNTVDQAGAAVGDVFHGSRYMVYDRDVQQMRIAVEHEGEQNSDLVETVTDFLTHAMTECVAEGHDRMMAVFAAHGGGFAGYGGDEHGRRRGRHLLQSNADLAGGIRAALDNVEGAPDRLEVLGFDACLMSAVGAADDYQSVARYLLASEAVEPGHGWSYQTLTVGTSPIDLANNILDDFIAELQGRHQHQTPKTLAIIDTDRFETFINAFEDFIAELDRLLQEGDVSLHTFLSRARASSVAFEGIADIVGTANPSALDIGSFFKQFETLCNPGGELGNLLLFAHSAYEEMFLSLGIGPGTTAGTGMHITWPHQGEYNANPRLWNQILFTNGNYVTQITPNFKAFMSSWLIAEAPTMTKDGTSVCGLGATIDPGIPVEAGQLMITDSGTLNPTTGHFDLETTIAPEVTQMVVEYGLDLSSPLKPVLVEKGYTPQDDEYLYLLGGDVSGAYSGSTFQASWDKNFYFLNITKADRARSTITKNVTIGGSNEAVAAPAAHFVKEHGFEALYVFDEGDGSRKIPVMYFPESQREAVAKLQFLDYLFFDFDYFIEQGARYSFLKFSVDEAVGRVNDNLALYVSDMNNGFSEWPRDAGGLILPLIYVDAYIQGRHLDVLPGGFNQTVIEWKNELSYNVLTTPAENVFNVIEDTDAVVVNMYAMNHADVDSEREARYFDVIRPDRGGGSLELNGEGDEAGAGLEEMLSAAAPTHLLTGTVAAIVLGLSMVF